MDKSLLVGVPLLLIACSAASPPVLRQPFPVPFEEGDLWGYRDAGGRTVIDARYHVAGEFLPEGIAAVANAEGWAYIDTTGAVIVRPYLFDNGPDEFCEGLARFQEEGRFGFFDRAGRVFIEPRFDWVEPFHDGEARYGTGCASSRD